ncbi:zinc finger, CCHC-type containing protein [Tanacetum coccineum]
MDTKMMKHESSSDVMEDIEPISMMITDDSDGFLDPTIRDKKQPMAVVSPVSSTVGENRIRVNEKKKEVASSLSKQFWKAGDYKSYGNSSETVIPPEDFTLDQIQKHLRIEEETRIRENNLNGASSSKVNYVDLGKNNKGNDKKKKGTWNSSKNNKIDKKPLSKVVYYKCGEKGHIKRYCKNTKKKNQNSNKKDEYANAVEQVDTTEITAMVSEMNIGMIQELHMASVTTTDDWWNMEIQFTSGKKLTLMNVLHVPNIRKNLVSGFKLCKSEVKAVIESDKVILSKANVFVGKAYACDGMFKLNINKITSSAYLPDCNFISSFNIECSTFNLWHNYLGHINYRTMKDMLKQGIISYNGEHKDKCKICVQAKMKRKHFPKVDRQSKILELVHYDICELNGQLTKGGNRYFITFIDDCSRYTYVYLLKSKDQAFETFKIYKAEVENQRGKKIQIHRSDKGCEYFSTEFSSYCESQGLTHQRTAPYTPQQNGVAERKNRILQDMINAMLVSVNLPKNLWGEALLTACHVNSNVIVESRDVDFFENKFRHDSTNINEIVTQIPQDISGPNLNSNNKRNMAKYSSAPRLSERARNERNFDFIDSQAIVFLVKGDNKNNVINKIVVLLNVEDTPKTYKEAITSRNSAFWNEAIDDEMDSLVSNNTWELLNLPPGSIAIGCRWFTKDYGVIICLYVDDILIVGTDMEGHSGGYALNQRHYIDKIIDKFQQLNIEEANTPYELSCKLVENGRAVAQIEYASAIGCLLYATHCTRPDIAYVVCKLSRYTSNPSYDHWKGIGRIYGYLKRTRQLALYYDRFPTVLEGYSDASWITGSSDSKSTTGWIFTLGGGAVCWGSKKQTCITHSTMEADTCSRRVSIYTINEVYLWYLKGFAYMDIRSGAAPTKFNTKNHGSNAIKQPLILLGYLKDIHHVKVQSGMDHVRVHPQFLHSNATSHKWALGAFAKLLDNSLDEVRTGATYVKVDVLDNEKDNRSKMLLIEDNGGGMTPDKMRGCMSLGYSKKANWPTLLVNTNSKYQNAIIQVFNGNKKARYCYSNGGMDHLRVHSWFLHSNATSHKWVFGAFAKLLTNSLDEVRIGATYVKVDMLNNEKDTRCKMLLIEDNGGGMTPDKMHGCMLLGYYEKSKLANTIGQYVLVFTRNGGLDFGRPTQSIGMLSYTFLMETGKQYIVVQMKMDTLVRWSPYSSEEHLMQQFDQLNDQGTRIIIYNIWEDEEGQLELDFDTDLHDTAKYQDPTSLFAHLLIAGIHPNANLRPVKDAFDTRKKWEAKSDKTDVMDMKVMQFRSAPSVMVEP